METAIYHDFEPRKSKGRKKREAEVVVAASLNAGNVVTGSPGDDGAKDVEVELASEEQENAQSLEEKEVVVLRLCSNPRLLQCAYSEDGIENWVLVRVKSNANFAVEMKLRARLAQNPSEVLSYEGALPRFKGDGE